MESLERFEPESWSSDTGVTTRIPHSRRPRQFASRKKESWVALTASATIFSLALAIIPNTSTITVPCSDVVQRMSLSDSVPGPKVPAAFRDVESGHWGRLTAYLRRFPREETRK